MTTVGYHYARSRARLTELLTDLPADGWERPVAACPGWRVRDVLAHLAGNVEDAMAGTLTGAPPTAAQTAEQVDRHRADDPLALLAQWNEAAPALEDVISALEIWPAAVDAVTHEHDIRGAIDRPGARDDESVVLFARQLIEHLGAPASVTVDLGSEVVSNHPVGDDRFALRATAFEVLRLRLGRRTPAQVRALDWERDPEPILDDLFVFGPTLVAIVE